MFDTLRHGYRDGLVRRRLRDHSRSWDELGPLLQECSERSRLGEADPWRAYRQRRSELVAVIATIVGRTAPLREVQRDLGLSKTDLISAYRILLRHSQRPFAVPPFHTPSALMLLPVWLEAVGALYLCGRLEGEAERLEERLIAMDDMYPLCVLEPLVWSGELARVGLTR